MSICDMRWHACDMHKGFAMDARGLPTVVSYCGCRLQAYVCIVSSYPWSGFSEPLIM